MKKLQGSTVAKVCAAVLLLVCAYGMGIFGLLTLSCAESVFASSWQDTSMCWNALAQRGNEIIDGVELYAQLSELRQKQAEGGEDNLLLQEDIEFIQEMLGDMQERFDRSNTWFRYRLMSADCTQLAATNLAEGEVLARTVYAVRSMSTTVSVAGEDVRLILEYGLPETVTEAIDDEFYDVFLDYKSGKVNFDVNLTGFINLSALTALAMLYLLWSCGHKTGTEEIVLTWQEKIFFDLYLTVTFCLLLFFGAYGIVLGESWFRGYNPGVEELCQAGAGLCCAVCAGLGVLTLRTLAVRLKAGCLARTTLLCRVVGWTVRTVQRGVRELLRNLPLIWKIFVVYGVYFLFTLFVLETWSGFSVFLWLLLNLAVFLGLCWWAIGLRRLREGTRALASGDLDRKIDTQYMPLDLRAHAEDLNNISVGMHAAVEQQMKSERFKAELITNVSHDLKTPLTSIINYVNLLKTTQQDDPKALEYIEVLDRKSLRLKKLTEDLVEASKASTGVLSVTREKIGMCQLLDQALGEYGEKLEDRHLSVIRTVPEEEVYVYADGRHLWRVIDNLLANCAKYAMEGTRVYVEVSRGQGKGMFSVKNISKEPLNVPADQLMERFVRGDSSRSTEGSGLGLSIARSLTELQAGSFELAVDGDLFKAVVSLPQYGA